MSIPVVSAWLNAIDGLPAVHARLSRVLILNGDALNVIRQQDGPRTLFYLDPPYFGRSLYRYNLSAEDFATMAQRLEKLRGKFILSLNDVPEVRALFHQFDIQSVELAYTAQKVAGRRYREVIIKNF